MQNQTTAKVVKKVKKQTLQGTIVSNKMQKTVVVDVSRFVKHPKYGKYYTINKNVKAHDEKNEYQIGDKVEIVSTRPISKGKSFIVAGKVKG